MLALNLILYLSKFSSDLAARAFNVYAGIKAKFSAQICVYLFELACFRVDTRNLRKFAGFKPNCKNIDGVNLKQPAQNLAFYLNFIASAVLFSSLEKIYKPKKHQAKHDQNHAQNERAAVFAVVNRVIDS